MTDRSPQAKKAHAAEGARILTAGISIAAGIGMVGAMTLATRSPAEPPPAAVPNRSATAPAVPAPIIVVVERQTGQSQEPAAITVDIPQAPAAPAPAPAPAPVAQSEGS